MVQPNGILFLRVVRPDSDPRNSRNLIKIDCKRRGDTKGTIFDKEDVVACQQC